MDARRNKRPLSIFEFPLKTWEEFCAIKLLADLAEILQVEDLLHCTFHPLRNIARATMPEERFHAQFGEDFSAELVKTPEGKARLQAAVDEYCPVPAEVLRRLELEEQRDVPQVGRSSSAPTRRCAPTTWRARKAPSTPWHLPEVARGVSDKAWVTPARRRRRSVPAQVRSILRRALAARRVGTIAIF